MHNNEIIQALESSAREIRSLRRQVDDSKIEAWEVLSTIIKQMFRGTQTVGLCPAACAEKIAKELATAPEVVVEQPVEVPFHHSVWPDTK